MHAARTALAKALRPPPRYILAAALSSLGGLLFGMDTGIIGPVTTMTFFKRDLQGGSDDGGSATVHGLIVSSILIPAAVSSFLGGRLADVVGRPAGVAIGVAIFALGAALEAGAVHLAMFIVGRVVEGAGEGLYLGTLVVYICEIAPPKLRGSLSSGPQLCITLGLVLGFFACYGTNRLASSLQWRLPFALLAALSALFAVAAALWLPHSPRWLTLRGRRDAAAQAWDALDVNAADREKAEDELVVDDTPHSRADSTAQLAATPQSPPPADFWSMWRAPARPRLLLAMFLMGMQQLSGIDGVLYYAPLLFEQAGLSSGQAAFLASGVSALVIFAVTVPALLLFEHWGRRASTILGGAAMAALMLVIGALYAGGAVHASTGAGRWVVIVAIYLFAVIFSLSWAVGIKVYAAEIQPQATRASATNLAHGANWATNFLVALVTPVLLASSSYGAYFLFGGCSAITAVVCVFCMPETRGRSLDEIDRAFRSSRAAGSTTSRSLADVLRFRGLAAQA